MDLKNCIDFLKRHKIIIFLLFLGCTPLIWFKNNLYLIYGDVVFPIYNLYSSDLINMLYSWTEQSYCGSLNLYLAKIIPLLGFWIFLRDIGLSFLVVERLWFIFVFVLPGMSMYYLVSVIKKGNNDIPKLISSLFYMFSPFVLTHSTTMQWGTLLVYGVSPLLLGLVIKGSKNQKQFKYVLLASLSSLLFAAAGVNLVTYSVAWIPVLFYALYDILTRRRTKIVFFTGKVITVTLLLNLFWIIPYIVYFNDTSPYVSTLDDVDIMHHLEWSSEYSKLGNLFHLLGKWGWQRGSQGSYYYPYHAIYSEPLFIFTLLIPIMLILSSALNKGVTKRYLFFFSLLLIGLFFAKGVNPPFGNVYVFLFNNIHGFWAFRESFPRFMPMVVLSYSVLLGLAAEITVNRLSRLKVNNIIVKSIPSLFLLFLIGIILFNVWPLITGDVVPKRKGELPGSETLIPTYWFEASDSLNMLETNTKIFLLPRSLPYQRYLWENNPYYGQDLTPYIIRKRLISLNSGGGYTRPLHTHMFMKHLYEATENGDINNMAKILGLLRVQYILQRNDLDWTHFGTKNLGSPDYIRDFLNSQKSITLKKSFEQLDLYEIDDKYICPQVYATTKFTLLDSLFNMNTLDSFLSENYDFNSVIFFSSNYPIQNKPNSIYKKVNFINTSKYNYHFSVSEGFYDIYLKIPEIFFNDILGIEISGKDTNVSFLENKCVIKNISLSNGTHDLILITQSKDTKLEDDFSDSIRTENKWAAVSGTWDVENGIYTSNGSWNKAYIKNPMYLNQSYFGNITEMYHTLSKTTSNNLHGLINSYGNESYNLIFLRSSTNSLHFRTSEKGEILREISKYYPNSNNTWYDIMVNKKGNEFEIFINNNLEMTLSSDALNSSYFGIVSYGTAEFDKVVYRKLFDLEEIRINKITDYPHSGPNIIFKKINPTKYNVLVEGATEPFFLVFSESFHPQWKAYPKGNQGYPGFNDIIAQYDNVKVKEARHEMTFTPKDVFYLLEKPMDEKNHFTANGYANSWYIDPKEIDKDGDGNFAVTLYFKPQSYFYLGLAISLTTLLLCILYLVWNWRKSRKKKPEDDAYREENPPHKNSVSALTPSLAPKEAWKTPKRKTDIHEKLESAAKSIGALRQSLAPKKAWNTPKEKKASHEKLIESIRTLKKDIHLKRTRPKAPKNPELRELKFFFSEKDHHPKYAFAPPPKPSFTEKELDKKAEDIKKRLMERDKGENR